jgi:chromosomal replication initiator protein
MGNNYKIITNRIPLDDLIPPMLKEIIKENIKKYVSDNGIKNYTVCLGYIEDKNMVKFDDYTPGQRQKMMNDKAKLIEVLLIDKWQSEGHNITLDYIYTRSRKKELIIFRQKIQFFLYLYSGLSLSLIGNVTNKCDHATVLNSIKKIYKKVKKNLEFREEMRNADRYLVKNIKVASTLFADDNSLLPLKRRLPDKTSNKNNT